jgi:hypothetical protein
MVDPTQPLQESDAQIDSYLKSDFEQKDASEKLKRANKI